MPLLVVAPDALLTFDPCSVKFPLLLMDPVFVIKTPPIPVLFTSAMKVILDPAPVDVIAPVIIIFRTAESEVAVVKFTVPKIKSIPLPCNVILPPPTIGVTLTSTPSLIVNVPCPLPPVVSNVALTKRAVVLAGFAALMVMAPPAVVMPALIDKIGVVLFVDNVNKLTLPPLVLIVLLIVSAPVFPALVTGTVAQVASPLQKVEEDAEVPEFRFATGRLPVTPPAP